MSNQSDPKDSWTGDAEPLFTTQPEAAGIVWTTVHTLIEGQDVTFNVTARGFDPEAPIAEAFRHLFADLERASRETGHKLTFTRPVSTPSQQPTQAKTPANQPNPTNPPKQPASPTLPERTQNRGGQPAARQNPPAPAPAKTNGAAPAGASCVHATKLTMTTREDGRIETKFFAAGHQFPDITIVRAVEDLLPLLQQADPWTDKHVFGQVGKPAKNIRYAVYWTPGKANGRGNPYKDVVAIQKEGEPQ